MPTIKDVANLAGVSSATVSKVYNHYSEIPQSTRDKVFEAAKILNYIPNKNAILLTKKNKHYIGLIVADLCYASSSDEYLFKIISGVNQATEFFDYELLIFTTNSIHKTGMTYLQFCQYHNLIGAIIHGLTVYDPLLKELSNSSIPCVLVDIHLNGINTATLTIDNYKAAQDVYHMLYQKGHRTFCHILGSSTAEVTKLRKTGFLDASTSYESKIHLIDGDFSTSVAYQQVKYLLNRHPHITAFFASSDLMALGALKALTEHGLTVGTDVALIGFDGLSTLEHTSPMLASVSQQFIEMGKKSVETLINIFSKAPYEQTTYVSYEILERESISVGPYVVNK